MNSFTKLLKTKQTQREQIAALTNGGAAPTIPWYLQGGIPPANCIFAHQWRNAASYALAKNNLANPGTYDATEKVGVMTWAAATGLATDGTNYLGTGMSVDAAAAQAGTIIVCGAFAGASGAPAIGCNEAAPATWSITHKPATTKFTFSWPRASADVTSMPPGTYAAALAGGAYYVDGVAKGQLAGQSLMASSELTLCAATNAVAGIMPVGSYIYTDAYYDIILTPTQVALVCAAMLNPPLPS